MQQETKTRSLVIGIFGLPNAGKSSLFNELIKKKISIISPKVQTTRFSIKGIITAEDVQLVFVDTPGIFDGRGTLERAIVTEAWGAFAELDVACFVCDAKVGLSKGNTKLLERIQKASPHLPKIAIVNKIDLIEESDKMILAKGLYDTGLFLEVFMTCAQSSKKARGVEKLLDHLLKSAKPSPWLFEEDDLTDAPQNLILAEITREQLFCELQQELPYNLMVETETFKVDNEGNMSVQQTILVSKESHRKMIIGSGGVRIRRIRARAVSEMHKFFETKTKDSKTEEYDKAGAKTDKEIHLEYFVKVRENWLEKPENYRKMGMKTF